MNCKVELGFLELEFYFQICIIKKFQIRGATVAFFIKLEFLKIKLHVKLKFQNSGTLQNISRIMVDC